MHAYHILRRVSCTNAVRFGLRRLASSTSEPHRPRLTKSYVHGASNIPLLDKTIGQLIDEQAEKHADKELFVLPFQNVRKTYRQFKQDVDSLGAGLIGLGLERGDRVGMWGPNSYEWLVSQFASAKAGLVLVNVNPGYRAHELEYCVNKVQIRALIAPAEDSYRQIMDELFPDSLRPKTRTAGQSKSSSRLPHLENLILISDKNTDGATNFWDLAQQKNSDTSTKLAKLAHQIQFDDPANIQFTSGTTGNPKGSTLTHHNIVNNAYFFGRRLGYGDRVSGGVPTMYTDQIHHENFSKYNTTSLTTGFMSGAPCPMELLVQVKEKMGIKDIIVGYGMTETSPVSLMSRLEDSSQKCTQTVGTALDHVEVKITDGHDAVVPIGEKGEIQARGFHVMRGYWDDDVKTDEFLTDTRWAKSGDLGVMDEDGYVKIVGRSKDVIIRGGENVFPAEIENCLLKHPQVAEAHIIGVPDKRLGEEICCWIKLKSDVSEQELKSFCKASVGNVLVFLPGTMIERDTFTVTGKVQKFKMREQSVTLLKLEGVHDAFKS